MLVAKDGKGNLINLVNNDFREKEREKMKFYCPSCNGRLVFKNGKIKIPHFAHLCKDKSLNCSEGETAEHLKAKILFYNLDRENCQLEVVLPTLKQRPDILFNQKIAVEIQCSRLKAERLQERISGYRQAGYQQWWIIGGELKKQKRLTRLTQQLCYFHEKLGFYFWTINPEKELLFLHFHVQRTSKKQRWQTRAFDLQEWRISDIYSYCHDVKLFHRWQESVDTCSEYQKKLNQQLLRKEPKTLRVQAAFYQQGSHLSLLPLPLYSQSDFYFYFEEWLFYFRFLIYQELLNQTVFDWKKLFDVFIRRSAPFRKKHCFPLIEEANVLWYFFVETVTLVMKQQLVEVKDKKSWSLSRFITQIPLQNVIR